MRKMTLILFAATMLFGATAACSGQELSSPSEEKVIPVTSNGTSPSNEMRNYSAKAELINGKKEKIGKALLTETPQGVKIEFKASKLSPGMHGFHIHETGKCTPPDFQSSGDHFNPDHKKHGFENPKGYHVGDLPNIKANKDGKVNVSIITKNVTLQKGKENSLFDKDGSAIVIHEKADDYKTDPAGNSGDRVACGVVTQTH